MGPYFSIVIPTKNRPYYLKETILSAVNQNFSDFEVIVSDNFNDERTFNVIHQFNNYKLKYFRTDHEMMMHDHWEFATLPATGKYVILLTDRKVLYQNALKRLYNILHNKYQDSFNACSFGVISYNEAQQQMGWNQKLHKTYVFKSDKLMQSFLYENIFDIKTLDPYYPKTLNGCYKNSYVSEIRKKYGGYFNKHNALSPDYASCFINLYLNPLILFIGIPIILSQGEQVSNGRKFGSGDFKEAMKSFNIETPFKSVPVNAPFIYNFLVVDFIAVSEFLKKEFKFNPDLLINYFSTLHYELLIKQKTAAVTKNIIAYFYSEWNKALVSFDEDIQKKVKEQILSQQFDKRIHKIDYFINFPAHFRDFINNRFTKYKAVNKVMKYRYNNAIEAAGFKKVFYEI